MDYSALLEDIVAGLNDQRGCGKVADYIPALAEVDAQQFGIALMELDGRMHVAGDADTRFSMQSISKVFALTLAMQHARDELWDRVGREPSGNRFNSLIQLEHELGIPRNPFINAGALVVTDVILEVLADAKQTLLELVRQLAAAPDAGFDDAVAAGEAATGHTNRAMAWFIKSFGNLHGDPEAVLDAYFHHCAIALSCRELARAGMFLAHKGCTLDGTCMLSPQLTQRINAMMVTCGAYDAVGDFAYRVGLPAKSGVGGGILAVMPGQFSVCVWSPGLDAAGNSMLGIRALEQLTARTGLSVF
jgi:glutaminase